MPNFLKGIENKRCIITRRSQSHGHRCQTKTRPDISGKRIAVLAPWVKDWIPEPDVVPDFTRALKPFKMQVTRIDAYNNLCQRREHTKPVCRTDPTHKEDNTNCQAVLLAGAEIEVALQTCKKHLQPTALRLPVCPFYTAAYARKKGLK